MWSWGIYQFWMGTAIPGPKKQCWERGSKIGTEQDFIILIKPQSPKKKEVSQKNERQQNMWLCVICAMSSGFLSDGNF